VLDTHDSLNNTNIPVGAVVVVVPMYVSHRSPAYDAGQTQYAVLPFIRHSPPDKQYPAGQPAIIEDKNRQYFPNK